MTERSYDDYLAILGRALPEVRKTVAAAEKRRGYDGVTLLAATKTVPVEVINYAIDTLGIRVIGENRVQELLDKYPALHKEGVSIHFIGRLQKNKVKYIIDKVDLIHSLDSLSLAEEIEKQAKKHDKVMNVLIEVNIGGEASKGGISPEELTTFYNKIAEMPHLSVKGLMVIPPPCEKSEESSHYFQETYRIFVDFSKKTLYNSLDNYILSMGMSDSYEEAILAGATLVRLGSALFGKRAYPDPPKESEGT